MLHRLGLLFVALLLTSAPGCDSSPTEEPSDAVTLWLTSPSQNIRFSQQADGIEEGLTQVDVTIAIDPSDIKQEIDGFGFALTGGSAYHISRMTAGARAALLRELFDHGGTGIGTSYLRISIGASDLDAEVFSYNDLPAGQVDPEMLQFSLDPDRMHLIPVLKEILAIAPELKILGSPWSPPVWMKTNGSSMGGSLKPEFHDAYARYFVRYIQEMAAEGIRIDAITVQNEPLHPGNNPSLLMLADQQATFIKDSLGPAFRDAGIDTKIIVYDHNADRPDYPISILNDPEARQYVDGSAFHLYGGDISALSSVHSAHPDKNIYFTEQWIGAPGNLPENLRWHVRELLVGATRNWSRNVIEWNLAADENQDPHTQGGCTSCLGAVTITGDSVTRNPAWYIIAHAAKFVRPGSRRIGSTASAQMPNVAFKTPQGQVVVIVLNDTNGVKTFSLAMGDAPVQSRLAAGAVGTYVWPAGN